ncbi:preprotein translocase subunit YajC [Acinetobacter haemolyticus]|nr:preprotein translocase subunit YajC [Acinetobacter haemolyticus]
MMTMTHNYMLGLAVLIFAFIFFYIPMVYAFLAIRKQQRKQNKS